MYKVLIVDDEKLIRNGLSRHYDWASHGLEVCGTADNGLSAQAFIENHDVDLVITDVCMPQMSGIELAQWLKRTWPEVHILFISGYEDLDYLKAALKVDAVDYILKPIDFDELGTAADIVVKRIEESANMREQLARMEEKLNESLPILKERLLSVLIRDEVIADEFYDNQIRFLDLPLSAEQEYILLVVRMLNTYANYSKKTERERQLQSMQLYDNLERCIEQEENATVFMNTPEEYICILPVREEKNHAAELSKQIVDSFGKKYGIRIRIGVSRPFSGYPRIKEGYEEALRALSRESDGSQNTVFSAEAEDEDSYAHLERLLLSAVNQMDEDYLNQSEEYLLRFSDRSDLENHLFYTLLLAFQIRQENDTCSLPENLNLLREQMERILPPSLNASDVQKVMKEICTLFQEVKNKRNKPTNASVTAVRDYISGHLNEPLTLAELSSYVYLTPSYLCQLFKRETGRNLSDYILRKRMNKAKELLLQPENRMNDICSSVGINSVSYFSKMFKKSTGMSPSEWRKVMARPVEEEANRQ